jgi:hypothetical protein
MTQLNLFEDFRTLTRDEWLEKLTYEVVNGASGVNAEPLETCQHPIE